MQMMSQVLSERYRLIRALGSGGFGETFLAEDTQMPSRRRCVIKQLKPVANNLEIYQLVKERFQREAAILEELGEGCSQIPKLYAYFEKDGNFYLVQEWIEGITLSERIRNEGNLSESSVQEILLSLLLVLDFVHSKHIVHRDIKPKNIILSNSDHKPVLIDFGAVKETMGTALNFQKNITSSIIIGTPGFMPSEQAAGRPVYASDLYSLGLTIIYLLTGKIPQELDSDPLTGEILWRRYALNISPTLAEVLDKAIHPVARDRYTTAKQMLESLYTRENSEFSPIISMPANVVSEPPSHLSTDSATLICSHPSSIQPRSTEISPFDRNPNPLSVMSGMNEGYKVMIMGSLIGGFILAGLFISKLGNSDFSSSSRSTTPTPTASVSPASRPLQPENSRTVPTSIPQSTPVYTPTPAPVYNSSLQPSISEDEAINLINTWLQEKQRIFAPPFDQSLAAELTTDALYWDITKPGGSVDWLVKNKAFYQFGVRKIESVGRLVSNGDHAAIEIEITEDRTFYVKGKINPEQTGFTTRWRTYSLKLENGRWKIANYK